MIRVYADDKQLDLAENPYIEAQLNSPYVGLQQQGSVIYPFSCPFTGNNDAIFGYFRLPESSVDRNKTYVGRVYDDNILILEGILKVKGTDTHYSIEIAGPPAGVPLAFWEKKINLFDIGTHEFERKAITVPLFALKITPEIEPYFGISGSTIKIYTRDREYISYDFPPFLGNSYNEMYNSGINRTVGEILQPLAYQFNEDNGLRNEGYELVISKQGINFFAPDSFSPFTKLKLSVRYDYSSSVPPKVFEFSMISYLAPILTGLENRTTENSAFVFPTIINPGFYPTDKNKMWCKYVNWFDGETNTYPENTYKNPTAYTLVPMLSFFYVLKKFLFMMNYQPTGAFFSDNRLKTLIIENTRSIDAQCDGLDLPFNIFKTSFDFKDHLPDMTVEEFFNEIKAYFALAITYDFVNRTANFDYISPVYTSTANEDFSNKVNRVSFENNEIKKVQFLPGTDFIPDEDKAHAVNLAYPTAEVVAANPQDYEPISSKISSLPVKVFDRTTETIVVRPRKNGGFVIPTNTVNQSQSIRLYPYCNQLGNSVLYEQDKQAFGFRLLFFLGKQKDSQDLTIIRADYQNELIDLSLNENANSRYTLFLKGMKEFIESAAEAETEVFLTDAEVASFNWKLKKYIRGVNFIVHQLMPTLPVKKAFKMKMKRAV